MKRFLLGLAGVCGLFCLITAIIAAGYYFGSSNDQKELQTRIVRLNAALASSSIAQSGVTYQNQNPTPAPAPNHDAFDSALLGGPAPMESSRVRPLQDGEVTLQTQLSELTHQRRQTAFSFVAVSIGFAAIGFYIAHLARRQPKALSDKLAESYGKPVA